VAQNSDRNDLLNIKQAAAVLNVSEVSLRRWTNEGSLPCVRVGKRRERRFRRSELDAYVADGSAPSRDTGRIGLGDAVVFEDIPLIPGSHLGAIYQNDQGRTKLAVPLLAQGLAAGDCCYLIAPQAALDQIMDRLRSTKEQPDAAIERGQFATFTGLDGPPEAICHEMETLFIDALSRGARRLRVVGDMSWAFDRGLEEDDLMAFERRYDHEVAPRYPVVSLCLYDARRFSGLGVLGALQSHPHTFQHNPARLIG
jgi:transcriptional repressor of dcmA and dcmR